jgi:uncharacterized repeat protein (TIGR01451 family)
LGGLILLAAITTPVAVTQIGGATAGATVGPDTIQYVQTTGSSGTYIKYVPGNGSAATKESVTSGGGCATPTPSGVPILSFSALYYNTPAGYAGSPTPAVVGAYKQRTGVCSITPDWGIEQFESLTFSVGTNTLVNGRLMTSASLDLSQNDKSGTPTQVLLLEKLNGAVVGQQNVSGIPGGTTFTANTGQIASGFDSIEIQVLSPSTGSVSVVGPQSTFTLGSPGLSLTKTDNLHSYSTVGQVVTYTVTATNSGYTTLSNVQVTDNPSPDSGLGCTPTSGSTLAPGASITCTGTHTITQGDIDAGSLSDTATATGTGPGNQQVSAKAGDVITAAQTQGLTLSDTDNLPTYTTPGQVATFTLTASNTGNVDLTNVQVTGTPALDGFSCTPPGSTLAPGGVITCTGTHTIGQADFFGAASYTDAGKVTGTAPGNQAVSANASDTISAQQQQFCPGQSIQAQATGSSTSGDVSGTITLNASDPACKSYSLFEANTNDFVTSPDDGKSIIFDSQAVAGEMVTATFDWGLVPQCEPDNSGAPSIPLCPVTKISFDDGATFTPQTYCAASAPPPPNGPNWCTTSKTFTDVVVNGVTFTHITETWQGIGDPKAAK